MKDRKQIEICMVCRENVRGTKYVVVKEAYDENLYYHRGCMPEDVRKRFQLNAVSAPNDPLLKPL